MVTMGEESLLRDINLDGYRLQMWDTYKNDRLGKSIIFYRFTTPDSAVLFEGEDFAVPSCTAIDSDDAVRSLVGFLTLRPGDTDKEYFEGYTPDQLDWAETEAEELSLWALEPEVCEECGGDGCAECYDTGMHGGPKLYTDDGGIAKDAGWDEYVDREVTIYKPWTE